MASKPLVYVHQTEEVEPIRGLNKAAQRILGEYFELVTESDLKETPDLAARVQGSLYTFSCAKSLMELLPRLTSLQVLSTISTGMDWVPVQKFKDMGIQVGYCPAYKQQNKTIADYAMLLLLAVSRKFTEELAYQQNRGEKWISALNRQGNDVTNKTLGIVGMGRIGTVLAKRAKGFDMRVVYHNRKKSTTEGTDCIEYFSDLDLMLPQCDFVAICCGLNESSQNMFKRKQFQLMKNNAILVNISRGHIVDTEELVYALKNGEIKGAGLDVTDPEPLPEGHALFDLPNVIITPHCSSHSQEAKEEVFTMVRDNLKAVIIDGKPPKYEA